MNKFPKQLIWDPYPKIFRPVIIYFLISIDSENAIYINDKFSFKIYVNLSNINEEDYRGAVVWRTVYEK